MNTRNEGIGKPTNRAGESVGRLQALLEREFESKWAALRKQTAPGQGKLLDVPPSNPSR
jgi:hypothetical protein